MTNPPFGFEAPEDSPGLLLWQTTMIWQRLIKKALEPYDISHAQFVILATLLWWQGKEKSVTQIDIVRMSKLDKMTVSISLKKLERMNLVDRQEHHEDTRSKTVQLTYQGGELARKLVPLVEKVDADYFAELGKESEKELIMALQRLVGAESADKT